MKYAVFCILGHGYHVHTLLWIPQLQYFLITALSTTAPEICA